uniref:Protein kinase domain-containing protein n=1 Tax=Setaria digitata TaxID=48799 RepID=A0A915PJ03_9BILA
MYRIKIPKPIQKKILEFKFIDHEMLLYCDALTCRLCKLSSPENSCKEYLLILNGKKVEELMYATAVKDSSENVNIRIVTENADKAAILRFPSYHSLRELSKLISIQSAEDIRIIDGHGLATAFNRRGYTFFVGSARRPYEPYINAKVEEMIVMSVRITRICDSDRTEELESRIDMALTCGNFSLRTNVRSLAAQYNPSSDELIVIFQNFEKNENVACKYAMKHVDNAFDRDCQKVQNSKELPPYCFIFSRRADGHAMRACSKFGGDYVKKPVDNCALKSFPSFAYRYGWLEQFHAFVGQLISVLPNSDEDILSVIRFLDDDALFTVHSGGVLNRISAQGYQMTSVLLWSLQLQQFSSTEHPCAPQYRTAADLLRSRVYFAQDNELSYAELTCSYFYDTCDSLERSNWSDPLQCLWCAMKNGSGYAFPKSGGSTCPCHTIDKLCAPFIEHVDVSSSSFSNCTLFKVYGKKFDRLQNIVAKVCGQNCSISSFDSTKLSCIVNMPNDNTIRNCGFYLEGKLGSFDRFNITFTLSQRQIKNVVLPSTHPHYSKAIATTFAVIVLALLIVFILYLLRQFHNCQRIRMEQCGLSGSQIALGANNHVTFVSSNPFSGLKGKSDKIKIFNPYENLFLEIDSKLKIPLKNLELGNEIGKGNFGIVYRGVYRSPTGHLVDVACKTIDSRNDGVITGISEFLHEGLIMANFDHPNVARLIGISLSNNNYPIIITDFMARGDLRHYIINPENRLTFGNLLDFGIQIAKGMTYLHNKQFIHRDLAARNCMLDACLVVKIADFGLSRDVSRDGMYQVIHKDRGIPIRWMPIESLEEQQYTFKADIWAYGVVLWELATRGLVPYADLESKDILRLLKSGHRLMKPKGCPDNLYHHVMRRCWLEDPEHRPAFFELTEMMEDVVRQLRRGVSGDELLDSHYERVSARSFTTPLHSDTTNLGSSDGSKYSSLLIRETEQLHPVILTNAFNRIQPLQILLILGPVADLTSTMRIGRGTRTHSYETLTLPAKKFHVALANEGGGATAYTTDAKKNHLKEKETNTSNNSPAFISFDFDLLKFANFYQTVISVPQYYATVRGFLLTGSIDVSCTRAMEDDEA